MSVLAAKDDYTTLCEGVRKLTGIDLLQYKRGQMERRIRTFATKQGEPDLTPVPARPAGRQGQGRRVPGPRDDQRLAAVAQPRAVDAARQDDPSRARRRGRSRPRVERRLLVRRRGLHARRRRVGLDPEGARDHQGHRHRPAHGRPRPQGRVQRRGRAQRAGGRACSAGSRRPTTAAGAARPSSSASCRSRPATCCSSRIPREAYDLVLCRNTVIYFNEPVRDALHERLVAVAAPRRRAHDRLHRAGHASRASSASTPPIPSSTARPDS